MPNYKNGKIYAIIDKVDEEVLYVGSTTNQVYNRMGNHRFKARDVNGRNYNQPIYKKMRIVGIDNVGVIEVEKFSCNTRTELEKREQFWIDDLEPSENCKQAGVEATGYAYHKAYAENNKESVKAAKRKYACANKEKIHAYREIYRKLLFKCSCGREIANGERSSHMKSKNHHNLLKIKEEEEE
jgi:hypothetical protein